MSHATLVAAPTVVFKRDGREEPFDLGRIERAIALCYADIQKVPPVHPRILATRAVEKLHDQSAVMVEGVQDAVVKVLTEIGDTKAKNHYVEYRAERERERNDRPIPADVKAAFDLSAQYFPTPIQQFQFFDKYSRFDHELGRRETWEETVNRAVDFLHELTLPHGNPIDGETWERVRRGILNMEVMPSMRLLAMAGPAARRNHISIFNCSFQGVDSLDSFVEALLISMSGCGVGYSVEQQYVEKLPRVKRQKKSTKVQYHIDDTTEGWCDALRTGLTLWFEGHDVEFDYSAIRPAGAILRTKGGRASGPDPLRVMMDRIRTTILSRQGNVLRPIDAHDIMCHVGSAAVQGGVRRTAMISLFDWDDNLMLHAKDGDLVGANNTQRWNANNSIVWPEQGITQNDLLRQMLAMDTSQNGEPGIFNRAGAWANLPERRKALGYKQLGTNPCVTGDTWVMTSTGARQVRDLVGKQFTARIQGQDFASTKQGFWHTGYKPIYEVRTDEGYTLRLTDNHKVSVVSYESRKTQKMEWREVKDIKPGDKIQLHNHRFNQEWDGDGTYEEGWLLGTLVGDGTFTHKNGEQGREPLYAHLDFWGDHRDAMVQVALGAMKQAINGKVSVIPQDLHDRTRINSTELVRLAARYGIDGNKNIGPEIERTSSDFHCGFLAGFFDSDGSVQGVQDKGVSVRLSQSNLPRLQSVQRMLLRLGVSSKVYQSRRKAQYRPMPDGYGGVKDYWCQDQHELIISNDNLAFFAREVGFIDPVKQSKLEERLEAQKREFNRERFTATVTEIVPVGYEDVYDCSIPGPNCFDANGMVAHNCGEILLRSQEFCNLSIAVARPWDTPETLEEKVELAAVIGTIQSLATDFHGLRPEWKQNCDEERLLGVDITGQADSPITRYRSVLDELQGVAISTNKQYASLLGINQSAAVTCVKPSGNSSQLLNTSSGLHPRHAQYYRRNIRVGTDSPMHKVLRNAGVPMSPENGQTWDNANTWVIHFPVKAPSGAITRDQVSAIQQCEVWLRNKIHWTEHNPSVTISYGPDELIPLVQWVWEHREVVGGMSFLPRFDARYDNMPYETITADEYERLAAEFPEIDYSKLFRYDGDTDNTTASGELACFAGQCEVEVVPTGEGK